MQHPADQRRIVAKRLPEQEQIARQGAAQLRETRLRLARALAEIDAAAAYVFDGCDSIVEYGVRLGLDVGEARLLANLGQALLASEDLAQRV